MKISVAIHNLGCAKNQVDGEQIIGRLSAAGLQVVSDLGDAEVIIINTCAFIETAKQETIREILRLAKYKDGACKLLIATGCFSQRYGRDASEQIPEVDAFVGFEQAGQIEKIIAGLLRIRLTAPVRANRLLLNAPHRAFLRISDGCNNRCTYCAIPLIRGDYRETASNKLIRQAQELEARGVKELILIGQDTTRYGHAGSGPAGLLQSLLRNTSIPWLRFLYTHPAHWDDRLIDVMASSKRVCPYIDVPVQHLSDRMLQRMGRKITRLQIKELLTRFRAAIPHVTLRTTVLVGFPGERERDITELLDGMKEIEFDRLGVFAYSREEGTPAFSMKGQISTAVAQERVRRVVLAQRPISRRRNAAKVGRQMQVLLEGKSAKTGYGWVGRSQADAPDVDGLVYLRGGTSLEPGQFVTVRIEKADTYDLFGVTKPTKR